MRWSNFGRPFALALFESLLLLLRRWGLIVVQELVLGVGKALLDRLLGNRERRGERGSAKQWQDDVQRIVVVVTSVPVSILLLQVVVPLLLLPFSNAVLDYHGQFEVK